jgi:hypothetical protein
VLSHGLMAIQESFAPYRVRTEQPAGQPLTNARPGTAVGDEKVRRLAEGEVGEGELFVPVAR